jgi:hypothetical protein
MQVGGVGLELLHPAEPTLVFPVLAHWTFTCTEAGDFQSRMQNLHVGLQGTLRPPVPPPLGRPAPPPTRPPAEVLATGHVALESITREGEPESVWYRGPFSVRPGSRTAQRPDGIVPLLHVSDQARRLGPDGREDVSLAVAFEIGRLLALAEPAVVAALLRWRRDAFAVARAVVLLGHDPRIAVQLGNDFRRVPILLGRELLTTLGRDNARLIGAVQPRIDPGLPFAPIGDLVATIANGFGLPVDRPDAGPPDVVIITNAGDLVRDGIAGLPHVSEALDRERERVTTFADELDRGVRP